MTEAWVRDPFKAVLRRITGFARAGAPLHPARGR